MAYNSITQGQFISDIATALSDSSYVYWSQAEIRYAIAESLYLWGALTSKWVERGNFTTVAREPFYALPDKLPSLRPRTITYDRLATELQYHLLESPSGLAGTDLTDQFSISSIISALLNARNRFLYDAGTFVSPSYLNLTTGSPSGLVELPDTTALLQRVAWIGVNGYTKRLWSSDLYQSKSFSPAWPQSPGTPYAYTQAELPGNQLQLIPPPLDSGTLHIISAATQSTTSSTLSLPDELCHAAKWLALSELLSTSGPSYDPTRAKYCLERYKQYTDLALFRCITSVYINNVPAPVDTLDNLDAANSNWQATYGRPTKSAVAYDLIALSKVPSSTAYSIGVDVVRSAEIPANDATPMPVSRDELAFISDCTRHILSFKLGGTDFLSTLPLFDSFLRAAQRRNALTQWKARYLAPLFDQTNTQLAQTPPT